MVGVMMSERAVALAETVRELRERFGVHAVGRGVPEQLARRQRTVEDLLPPWWADRLPAGHRLVELAGPASCGKLGLALAWLAALRERGLIAVVDPDRRFYPPAAAAAGIDLDRLVVVRPPGRRESVEAVTLLAGSAGFEAILWPIGRRTLPDAAVAMRLGELVGRSQTRILTLLERPQRAEWWGMTSADVRLVVGQHEWRWVDGELAGVDLVVRAERVRGLTVPEWEFRLDGATVVRSGARAMGSSRVSGDGEVDAIAT